VSGESCPRSKLVSEITEYQRGIISAEQVAWLSKSQAYIRRGRTCFVHGGWQDPIDQYLYEISEDIFPDETDIFFAGHTHVQALVDLPGKRFCNPGSVGQPRDGDARSAFATFSDNFSDNAITLHRVAYDIDETAYHMRKAGFPAPCYENLYLGAQIGGRIDKIVVRSAV
jgi:diadenosine tetraphosphatase ApaH/serine/threonine PP2A family protein phosphatase